MSGRWLAFVESNTSGTGRLFARAAARQGLRPIVLAADPARYDYVAEDGLAARRVDTQDERALLAVCRELAAGDGLAGIWSSSEYFIATAAALAGQLGLAGPRAEAIRACRDKHQQRLRLRAAGVGVPAFAAAESVEQAVAAAGRLGYPVVVKPVDGSGSVGVRLCAGPDEVAAHAAGLLGQRQNERGLPTAGRALVEALAVGPEYSVETFGAEVVGVTAKHLGAPPFFVEVGHDFPAALPDATRAALADAALRALAALDLGWGPAHVELRMTAGGPAIIEVNPRLAGGFIPELVRLAHAVDLIDETVRLVVGGAAAARPAALGCASIRFLLPPVERLGPRGEGTLARVAGLDQAARLPGVAAVELYARPGARVRRSGDFRERVGHVIALGATPAQSAAAAQQALALIHIELGDE